MVTQQTPQQQPAIAARFERVRRRLRSVRVASGCIAAVGVLAAAVLLADGVDFLHTLREPWVLCLVCLGAALAAAVLLRACFQAIFKAPSTHALALAVEQARPELMDALVCAVELEAQPDRAPNPIEAALLTQVRDRLQASAALDLVFERRLRWRRLLWSALIFAACMGAALNSRAWQKAAAHAGDLWRGAATGLVLNAPTEPVAEHSDVRLEADVRRWEPEASIEYIDAEGRHRFGMNRAAGARSFFTFYDVTQTVRYRVVTPSLASRWQRLEVYRPPSFEQVTFQIEPPAYTGRQAQTVEGCRDLHAVVGSRLAIQVQTQPGVSVERRSADTPAAPFTAAAAGAASQALVVERDLTFHLALRSPAGWEAASPEVRLIAQPDLPPVVTLLQPPRDAQAKADDTVPLQVRAADDFGVQRLVLTYAISGSERRSVVLFEAGAERVLDQTADHGFDLAAIQATPGDVISYSVSALDNRDPEPQETRTEVCFIVVRPDLDNKDKEGNEGEQKKLDIGPLIAESKRLIRFTWDALGLPASERGKPLDDLHRDLNVLRLEIRKVFSEILKATGGEAAGPIPELFGLAEREVAEAVLMAERKLVAKSQPPQERALAALTRIENELLQNAARGKGKGDSAEPKPPPPESSAEAQRSQQEALQALRDAKSKVQELAERQDRLNQELARSPTLSPEAAKGLAEKQGGVAADTSAVAQGLAALTAARRAADTLAAGAREMGQGVARLDQADTTTAERHGRRASGLLDAAIKDLDEALRKAASDRIRALAQAAEQLSDAQRAAADSSRDLAAQAQPPPAALDAAEKTQRQLNTAASDLRAAVDQTAGELDESYPEASQALGEALQAANRQGLERTMSRAANALLYRKPDRALKPQTDAANQLLEFARGLDAAAGKLPALSREELIAALQATQQQSRQTAQAMQQPEAQGQQQLESIRQQASQTLDPLAATLQDPALQEVADQMGGGIGEGSASAVGDQMQRLFHAAIGILERQIMAAEVRRHRDLSRRTSVPPEKYRRQVEQYFRDLGREP